MACVVVSGEGKDRVQSRNNIRNNFIWHFAKRNYVWYCYPPLFAKFLKKRKFWLTSINFNDEMSSFHFDPQKQNELSPNSFFSPPVVCALCREEPTIWTDRRQHTWGQWQMARFYVKRTTKMTKLYATFVRWQGKCYDDNHLLPILDRW